MSEYITKDEFYTYLDKKFDNTNEKIDGMKKNLFQIDGRVIRLETQFKQVNGNGSKPQFQFKLDLTKVFYFLIAGILILAGVKMVF